MKIHIFTPFRRVAMIPTLIHWLRPMNVEWHPICNLVDNLIEAFKDVKESWVKPFLWPSNETEHNRSCYGKANYFMEFGDIIDDDYYIPTSDEDMFEPGFFDVIRQQTNKILVSSLYRGDAIPTDGVAPVGWHPTDPLIMTKPGDMRVGRVGFAMITMKGILLKQTKFPTDIPNGTGDGVYAEYVASKWPGEIKFLPNLFAFGGFFQRGRYTRKDAFLKPNWELPVWITQELL